MKAYQGCVFTLVSTPHLLSPSLFYSLIPPSLISPSLFTLCSPSRLSLLETLTHYNWQKLVIHQFSVSKKAPEFSGCLSFQVIWRTNSFHFTVEPICLHCASSHQWFTVFSKCIEQQRALKVKLNHDKNPNWVHHGSQCPYWFWPLTFFFCIPLTLLSPLPMISVCLCQKGKMPKNNLQKKRNEILYITKKKVYRTRKTECQLARCHWPLAEASNTPPIKTDGMWLDDVTDQWKSPPRGCWDMISFSSSP